MHTHLKLRGTQYYIRGKIPKELKPLLGIAEVMKSLGTTDARTAAKICRERSAHLDKVFDDAAKAFKEPEPPAMSHDANLNLGREGKAAHWLRKVLETAGGTVVRQAPLDVRREQLNAPESKSLDSLMRRWNLERKTTTKTQEAMTRALDKFKTHVGNISVPAIKKAHIVKFKDNMFLSGQTPKNINYTLTQISMLCSFAVGQDWINVNPCAGIRVKVADDDIPVRLALPEKELNLIFSCAVYTDGHRPLGGRGEAVYWLPLLALFTGARLNELCQLSPNDIRVDTYRDESGKVQKQYVMILTNEGEGQALKNSGSRRRLPIHAELLARGFIEYVDSHKGNKLIFPLMKADKHGSYATTWSKWWHEYLREKIKITDRRYVFHSFRHTFKDVCRELGIDKGIRDAIQGHSEGGAAGGYGGEYYPLRPLVEAMNKYKVTGVQLPR